MKKINDLNEFKDLAIGEHFIYAENNGEPIEWHKCGSNYAVTDIENIIIYGNKLKIDVKVREKDLIKAINGENTSIILKNDRPYLVGGIIHKLGYTPRKGYTGHIASFEITHIITHDDFPQGIEKGYVMCSLRFLSECHQ